MRQIIRNKPLMLFVLVGVLLGLTVGSSIPAFAAQLPNESNQSPTPAPSDQGNYSASVDCEDDGSGGKCTGKTAFMFGDCGTDSVGIKCLADEILKFLSIGVGIAVVGGITVGGIVYSTSEGNPSKTQSGIKIITNSLLGLIIYLLMFAIIQFLIPGSPLR